MAMEWAALDRVWVNLGGRPVLEDVSFSLSAGDFVLLRGANGTGKTTMLKCLLGLCRPTSGSVRCAWGKGGAGYVPQIPSGKIVMPLRVRDAVAIGRCPHCPPWRRLRPSDRHAVDQALATVGMTALADRPIRMLSGGERRKMELARVLAQDPRALLLDEPTTHLDADSRREFMNLLDRIHRASGVAVMLVTHDESALPGPDATLVTLRDRRIWHSE